MDSTREQRPGGRNVITRPSCPSTQDILRDEALAGAPAGTAVITDHQTAGRGRRGRTWTDPPGKALMFSYLARPIRPVAELSPLALVVGIAVTESLPVPATLRWPNDVIIGGAKVAGILVELVTPAAGSPFAIVGIGINANLTVAELPPTDRLPATSLLAQTGAEIDRVALFEVVAARLDAVLEQFDAHGFAGLLPRYAILDGLAGHQITLRLADGDVAGTAAGVDGLGRLLLTTEHGTKALMAGEVERVLD